MIEEIYGKADFTDSLNFGSLQSSEKEKTSKRKSIQKGKGNSKNFKNHGDHSEGQSIQLTKEQKKEIQKEKNRLAAQLSRDRQKKYVEDLQEKVKDLEKLLQDRVCRKCKVKLSEYSTSEDQNYIGQISNQYEEELHHSTQDIIKQQPQIEPLPFIRVPFQKSQMGFGKMGRFFCVSLLIIAVFCLSNSVQNSQVNSVREHRLMQAVSDVCTASKISIPKSIESSINVPSTLNYGSNWLFRSNDNDDSLDSTNRCKGEFWENYLNLAREEISGIDSRNLLNCNSPSLVRITDPRKENDNMNEKWTFLISDPAITHAHFENSGEFYVDEVDYLDGVYQMVAQRVVLTKVIGKNCLA